MYTAAFLYEKNRKEDKDAFLNKWKQTRNDKIRSIPVYVRIVTSGFCTLVLVVMAVLLVGVRFLGYTPFVVLSPSMAPTYLPGTLVYVRERPFEQIEKDIYTKDTRGKLPRVFLCIMTRKLRENFV